MCKPVLVKRYSCHKALNRWQLPGEGSSIFGRSGDIWEPVCSINALMQPLQCNGRLCNAEWQHSSFPGIEINWTALMKKHCIKCSNLLSFKTFNCYGERWLEKWRGWQIGRWIPFLQRWKTVVNSYFSLKRFFKDWFNSQRAAISLLMQETVRK